jgi:hypothetical protein
MPGQAIRRESNILAKDIPNRRKIGEVELAGEKVGGAPVASKISDVSFRFSDDATFETTARRL